MIEKCTYLFVDLFSIIVPLIFSFHSRINFYKQWHYWILPCLLSAGFFLIWDYSFTKWGIWWFNPNYVLGYYIYNLPVEEVLFFVCIPFSCVFIFYTLGLVKFKLVTQKRAFMATSIAALILFVIGIWHLPQLYTSVTFISLSVSLLALRLLKVPYLSRFYLAYLIILLPFFITNGILTGSFINRTVVGYNNHYNLGIRLLTIPIEDIFYGMLLILMHVVGFEWFRQRFSK